jgi:hypothetical protein
MNRVEGPLKHSRIGHCNKGTTSVGPMKPLNLNIRTFASAAFPNFSDHRLGVSPRPVQTLFPGISVFAFLVVLFPFSPALSAQTSGPSDKATFVGSEP